MNKNDSNALGSRVKWAREKAKISQTELAKEVGLSQATLSDFEKGTTKTSKKIVEIAGVLGVDTTWLATGEGSPSPEKNSVQDLKDFAEIILQSTTLSQAHKIARLILKANAGAK